MEKSEKHTNARRLGMVASYLAACALANQVPQGVDDVDLEELYRFCKFHFITAIVCMGLEMVWKDHPADPEQMKQWRQTRDQVIRKNVLLNAERERICRHLESIGCWYMPLKGSLLQFDYPIFGMRQMSDSDILCDPAMASQIRDFMLSSGYTCVQYGLEHHDKYSRKPVYNFEIHRSLFGAEKVPVLASYYADIHSRSIKDPGNSCGYHLNRSDFYVYFTAHAMNHFQESGIGIRYLVDVYVFLDKYAGELDRDYVDRELQKLDALEFERLCSRLSMQLFDTSRRGDFTEEDLLRLDLFFCSGAYGTAEQLFRNAYDKFTADGKKSGVCYFLNRTFPPAKQLMASYPIVKRHKWMVPFVWIYRLFRAVLVRPGRIFREIRTLAHRK